MNVKVIVVNNTRDLGTVLGSDQHPGRYPMILLDRYNIRGPAFLFMEASVLEKQPEMLKKILRFGYVKDEAEEMDSNDLFGIRDSLDRNLWESFHSLRGFRVDNLIVDLISEFLAVNFSETELSCAA